MPTAGDLGHRRLAAQVGGQLGDLAIDPQRQLLQIARHPHRPRPIAEIALDLPQDRRHRITRERHIAAQIEPIDRLHQPQTRHLEQVVERLLRPLIAPRQLAAPTAGTAPPATRDPPDRGDPDTARTARDPRWRAGSLRRAAVVARAGPGRGASRRSCPRGRVGPMRRGSRRQMGALCLRGAPGAWGAHRPAG